MHGAKLDAKLLSNIYLKLTSGKQAILELKSTRNDHLKSAIKQNDDCLKSFLVSRENMLYLPREDYAEHKKFNDSFSNTYGSNIFDICIGIGLPVLLYTIFYPPISVDVNIDTLGLYNLGDYFMGDNLMLWSVFILFIFRLINAINF